MAALSEGKTTFSKRGIENVLAEGLFRRRDGQERLPCEFHSRGLANDFGPSRVFRLYNEKEQINLAEQLCEQYYAAVGDPEDHWGRLDKIFSELVCCNFMSLERHMTQEQIVEEVYSLLARLPATPVPFETQVSLSTLHKDFFNTHSSDSDDRNTIERRWENLKVVTTVSTNVIRVAIRAVMILGISASGIEKFIDLVAQLLTVVSQKASGKAEGTDQGRKYFLIQAFLWTTWQRTMMLFFWVCLKSTLNIGYNYSESTRFVSRTRVYGLRAISPRAQSGTHKIQYLCPWAFELLRAERSSILQDFRIFYDRICTTFAEKPARCKETVENGAKVIEICKGTSPQECQRFEGMKVKDQSAHNRGCPGDCVRLRWDEVSFRSINGSRAVSLTQTDKTHLRYCPASTGTLVISHVWSHGQGGRPTDGFNICLHQRYTTIAQNLGCDSYWIDAACIPQEYALRHEAIMGINSTFTNSKATLICDRDFMDIAIQDLDISIRESVLATLLVCDWNVRAWTLLEGMRGRRNVQILCKDNKTLSLRECFQKVLYDGRIDLIILLMAAQHLIPYAHQDTKTDENPKLSIVPSSARLTLLSRRGQVKAEEGARLLSHRHASRPGDEMVIWSLLRSNEVYKTPIEFWNAQQGLIISTGYLMSNLPRIKGHKGLGWALTRPNFLFERKEQCQVGTPTTQQFLAYDGQTTHGAIITPNGLEGLWLVAKFKQSKLKQIVKSIGNRFHPVRGSNSSESSEITTLRQLQEYAATERYGEKWIAFLRPMDTDKTVSSINWSLKDTKTPILAIVTSANGLEWQWQEVFQWKEEVRPALEAEDILLI